MGDILRELSDALAASERSEAGWKEFVGLFGEAASPAAVRAAAPTVSPLHTAFGATADKGEGLVVVRGHWRDLEYDLIKLVDEGIVDLTGAEPALVKNAKDMITYEQGKFGPYVAFSRAPEEMEDGRVFVLRVNSDTNLRTVRFVLPALKSVGEGRYTLDGSTPIEYTLIESASERPQGVEALF